MAEVGEPVSLAVSLRGLRRTVTDLQCVECFGSLILMNDQQNQPIQLPDCQHILCSSCFANTNDADVIECKQCRFQNSMLCDTCELCGGNENEAQGANVKCRECDKLLCQTCREGQSHIATCHSDREVAMEHDNRMQLSLLERIRKEVPDEVDGHGRLARKRRVTDDAFFIASDVVESEGKCLERDHYYGNTQDKQDLKYYCRDCNIPVCGACSDNGDHKFHTTSDLFKMKDYFNKKSQLLKTQSQMLHDYCWRHCEMTEQTEKALSENITKVNEEMNSRKDEAVRNVDAAYNNGTQKAEKDGRDILWDIRKEKSEAAMLKDSLSRITKSLGNMTVEDDSEVYKIVGYCRRLQKAAQVIEKRKKMVKEFVNPQQHARRLVLPNMTLKTELLQHIANVGAEYQHLRMHRVEKYPFDNRPDCLVVCESEKFILTRRNVTENNSSCFLFWDLNRGLREHKMKKGTYSVFTMASKEMVLSFRDDYNSGSSHMLHYCEDYNLLFRQEDKEGRRPLKLREIHDLNMRPYGLAVTRENNILVCQNEGHHLKGKKEQSLLSMFSLQGKRLKDSVANLEDPRYVAVSRTGEIAVSDTASSSIVVLSGDLQEIDRIEFTLPTSMNKNAAHFGIENYRFKPHGICYDHYGRILVADPDNDTVLRLSRSTSTGQYSMEPLLVENENIPEFKDPKLVAMGPDLKLWVACASHIIIFNYCSDSQ